MECPFKKETTIKVEYNCSDYANARGKPGTVVKTEEFGDCSCSCMAYDDGICLMVKGNK